MYPEYETFTVKTMATEILVECGLLKLREGDINRLNFSRMVFTMLPPPPGFTFTSSSPEGPRLVSLECFLLQRTMVQMHPWENQEIGSAPG